MAGVFQHGYAVRRESRSLDALSERLRDGPGRAVRLPAAPQDAGVAAFEGKGRRVGGHVGPGFVDDGHHPHGDRTLFNAQPVGARHRLQRQSHRVGQGGYLTHPIGHGGHPASVQRQTVQHNWRYRPARRLHVEGVFPEDGLPPRLQGIRHVAQRLVSPLRRRAQQGLGGRLGGAELFHCGHDSLPFAINLVPTGSPAAIW